MKNNGLPDSKEWEKIIEDAFSSSEKHDFSVRYELQKAAIQKGITMKNSSNFIHRRYTAMVAAAAAIVVAVPASVYAFTNGKPDNSQTEIETTVPATELTSEPTTVVEETTEAPTQEEVLGVFQIEQTANYRYHLKFKPTPEAEANNQKYNVEFTWIPDGSYADPNSNRHTHYTVSNGMFDALYISVSSDVPFDEEFTGIAKYDEISDEEKTAYVLHDVEQLLYKPEPNENLGRSVWVQFNGTNVMAFLNLTDDISDEELRNIINGLKLVPSDEDLTRPWVPYDRTSDINPISEDNTSHEVYSTNELNIANIGKPFNFELNCGDNQKANVSLTINDAHIQDNFDGINTDICGNYADFSQYLNEDGKIYDTINWIKYGDQIDTIDEIVKSEDVQMKVLVLDLTYTNNSDIDLIDSYEINERNDSLVICPERHYFPNNTVDWFAENSYDEPFPYSDLTLNNGSTFSISADNNEGKYSIDLPANRSVNVKMACLVRADQINDTYFSMVGYGCTDYKDYMEKDYFFPVKSVK